MGGGGEGAGWVGWETRIENKCCNKMLMLLNCITTYPFFSFEIGTTLLKWYHVYAPPPNLHLVDYQIKTKNTL